MRAVKGSLGRSFKERFREVNSAYWMRAAQKEQAATCREMVPGSIPFSFISIIKALSR